MDNNFVLDMARLTLMAVEEPDSSTMKQLIEDYGKEIDFDNQEEINNFFNYAMPKIEELYPKKRVIELLQEYIKDIEE